MFDADERRVLVLAPTGRDAALLIAALGRSGIAARAFPDARALTLAIDEHALAAIVTTEALGGGGAALLRDALASQPPWSEPPVVLLTTTGRSASSSARLLEAVGARGAVTLLERPVNPAVLSSVVRAVVRARVRQFEVRDLLARLARSVRERDHFLATLGHELRNPLGAIRNALELANEADVSERERALTIGVLRRQSDALQRLLDDLLEVARVTAGKVALRLSDLDLREVVRATVETLRPALDAGRHSFVLGLSEHPVWVRGDALRLEQVFGNLITNALKYTPAGGTVDLALGCVGDEAVLVLRDSGVGLSPEMLTRVFEPFTQAERTLERAEGGMGIGLALVRSLVELHHGVASAESAGLGRGSTFTVRLPLMPAAPAPPGATAADEVAPASGRRRILIVEDNDDNREMLKILLEHAGHEVYVVADGLAAVDAVRDLRPEAAVVDIGLPGIDGYEVARRVRACRVPVFLVALTGYGRAEDRELAREVGFDAHIAKPVDLPELRRLLARAPAR